MTNHTTTTYLIKKEPLGFERIIFRGCLLVSALVALYFLTKFAAGNISNVLTQEKMQVPELMSALLQCFLGAIVLYVPMLVSKVTKIRIPDALCSFYYVFALCGTIFGEAFSFYYAVPHWDSVLHFSSGIMAGMIGGILVVTFLQKKKCEKLISPVVIVFSIICIGICVGVVWEIYEFSMDTLLGVNMQKWMFQDGTSLVGQAALVDTMKDLIIDLAGAIAAAISACSSLKQRKGWLYSYLKITSIETSDKFVDRKEALPYSA